MAQQVDGHFFGDRNMQLAGCTIDTAGTALCGVRIRELSGCRHVTIVDNAYTGMNNMDYYFSVGGIDVTGEITSAPIPGGDCSGCVPPAIQAVQVSPLPECGSGPVSFSVAATGTDLDYGWRSPTGAWIGYGPQGSLANGVSGQYVVTVSNACGTATDTLAAGFDPDLCDPPVLDSAWFEIVPPFADEIRLHTAGTGSCLSYEWIPPSNYPIDEDTSVTTEIPAVPGAYAFILHSLCGSDTVVLDLTPEMLCIPPEISMVTSGAPAQLCNMSPFALHVEGSGTPAPVFEWTAPDGSLAATGDSAWLDPPQDGLYMVRAISSCGVDSAYFPVQLDTTGLAACLPPVILGITSELVCAGDTTLVQAQVSTTGPCSTYQWGGVSGPWNNAHGLEISVVTNSSSPLIFWASNACGTAEEEYSIPVIPQHNSYQTYCGLDGPVNLDSIYADYLVDGGYWELNGAVVSGIYQLPIDSIVLFHYWQPDGCVHLTTWLYDGGSHYAGKDASIQICSDSDPVDLFPLLGPGAEAGGHWYYASIGVIDGYYDPDQFSGNPTTIFRYLVGGVDCKDTAYVTVTETPGPFPWYADADGDGLGDPLDSLLSCDSIPGYVTVAGDDCPLVPGTIGSPCDEGLAWTLNDTLDAQCLCMGIPTAVLEQDEAQWRLWPNPARDRVYLQAPPLGPVSVTVLDARGRAVQALKRTLAGAPVSWPVAQLARGTYAVRILSPQAVRVLRLAVQ